MSIKQFDIFMYAMDYDEDFMFDNPRRKTRPVLIAEVLPNGTCVTVTMITSKYRESDYVVRDWQQAGLSKPGYIRFSKIRYANASDLGDYVGHLSDYDIQRIKSQKLIKESVDSKIDLLESEELIEKTVNDIEKEYSGHKRWNHNLDVELIDQSTDPVVSLKFRVHGHDVFLTFENDNIKTKDDLKKALSQGNVSVNCDCADNKYRFAYHQTANGYGLSKEHRRPERTNPNNDKGPGCKHIAQVIKNRNSWIEKVKLPD